MTPNLHFIDVGANIGVYSLFALSLSENVEVTAVEPSSLNFSALRANVELNPAWRDRIACIMAPLSNASLDGFWNDVSNRVGDSGHQFGMTSRSDAVPVRSITGDSLVGHIVSNKKVLLKIDVDGSEVQILEGFTASLLQNLICSILVELDKEQFPIAKRLLDSHGYVLDTSFDSVPGHSTTRRTNAGSTVRNYIFRPKKSY